MRGDNPRRNRTLTAKVSQRLHGPCYASSDMRCPTFPVRFVLTALLLTFTRRAHAEATTEVAQASAPPAGESAPLASVRAIVGLGAADVGISGRGGLQGEWWKYGWMGLGARAAYGEDSPVFGGSYRDLLTL